MRRNQSPESMLAEIMWNEFSMMGHLEHESDECEHCAWTRKMATRGAEIVLARLAEEGIELVSLDAANRLGEALG